jgi:phosphohistidine swiveling domain-containing protein
MGFVRHLDGSGARVDEVGGKAAGLDRLLSHGFPVPTVAAITVDMYRTFIAESGLQAQLARVAANELPTADRIEAETAAVDEMVLAAELSPVLEQEIRSTVRLLLHDGPIAVRSSATAEDMGSASFAGQYRTLLEIEDEDAALEAVKLCWASLWGPSVRSYRQREQVPEDDLAMAVALQVMVPALHAGVVFTRDPLGDPETARVEIVEGLGEALVSGEVTPDDYRVDRSTLSIRGTQTGEAPDFIEDLVRMTLRVERRFGAPMDVEWAHDGEQLLLLQARPITIQGIRRVDDDGFDTEPEPGHTYTPYGLAEMLPGVLPPLLWSINAPMLDNAFRRLFADLEIPPPEVAGPFLAVGRFRGRAALNLSVLKEAAASMPGGSAAEVERQYLGRVVTDGLEDEPDEKAGLRQTIAGLKSLRVRRRVEDEVALFADAVEFILAIGANLESLPVQRLLAYRARIRDLAWRGYEAEVAASAGAAAAYRGLEMGLERWVGGTDASFWAQRLTAGPSPDDQAGTNCAAELWDLYVADVQNQPPCDSLISGPVETTEARLEALGEDGARFVTAVHRTMRHFGSMALYGDVAWDEDPTMVWDCVASMARCDVDGHEIAPAPRLAATRLGREEAFDDLVASFKSSWKWRLTRIVTGQVVDMRRRMLAKLASDATQFLSLRERAKAALLILGGEERRLITESARRLVSSGLISNEGDTLMLSDQELGAMLMGDEPVSMEEIDRRSSAYQQAKLGEPLPQTFTGQPGVEEYEPIDGHRMDGWAASPGIVRGRVRLLATIADGAKLEAGDILVARSTDPSWTPLFLIAGGIVLEEGGPLSHAAIVAREFGLPAVLNVKGALRSLEEGTEIEVDGTSGTVTLIETVAGAA